MSRPLPKQYYFPNKIGRSLLLSFEEILGKNGLDALLIHADLPYLVNNLPPNNLDFQFNFRAVSRTQNALESIYGPRAGHGLAIRTGRAFFSYWLREFGPILGVTELSFRLLPMPMKLQVGLESLTETFNRFSDQRAGLEVEEKHFRWNITHCAFCWQSKSEVPACHLAVGILQECMFWVSGGKLFQIEETNCIAKGDASCSFQIEKISID